MSKYLVPSRRKYLGEIRRKFSSLAGEGVSLWVGYEVSESTDHDLWACFLLSAALLFLLPCLCFVIMESKTLKLKPKINSFYVTLVMVSYYSKRNITVIQL